MRAVVVTAFETPPALTADWPQPRPGPGEVAIRVGAVGLNFADLLMVSGRYQARPPLPFVPGEELAGTVSAVGAGVDRFQVGDRVLALPSTGAYAEVAVAAAGDCFPIPATMDFVTAAAFGASGQAAWFALTDRARLEAGETVLITGAAGGIGLAAVQLAKALGARVLAGIGSPGKAQACLDAGADAVVDLGVSDLRHQVGTNVDVLIDTIGGNVFAAALRTLAWRGRAVVIGFAAGDIPTVRTNYLLLKNIAVAGLNTTDYRQHRPDWVRVAHAELLSLWENGRWRPLVSEVLDFADFAQGLALLEQRRVVGKVVLTMHYPVCHDRQATCRRQS